jgi:hypothetical protein
MKAKIISVLVVLSYLIVLLEELLKKSGLVINSAIHNAALITRIIILLGAVFVFLTLSKAGEAEANRGK